jgi:hypothetical protein
MAGVSAVGLGRPVQDAHLNGPCDGIGRLRTSPEPATRRLDLAWPLCDRPMPLMRASPLHRSRTATTIPNDAMMIRRLESPAHEDGR